MKEIPVKLKNTPYSIVVSENAIVRARNFIKKEFPGKKPIVITNRRIWRLWGEAVSSDLKGLDFSIIYIKDSEEAKSFSSYQKVLEKVASIDREMRSVVIIAVGGGVVGDLAGFVAATYRRGVPIVHVPTTLLAQIDSSIGGKTAINLPNGKNLVGAYHQPSLVAVCPKFISTLPARQIREGVSEGIKYGVIRDKALFAYLESVSDVQEIDWEYFIDRCASIKANVVARDEKETKGLRFILNFGHTIGHAIEASCGYGVYSHGEAVAIGMACACDIAVEKGILPVKTSNRIESLIRKFSLPVAYKGCSSSGILSALTHDKKFSMGKMRFILPLSIGRVALFEDIPLKMIKGVIERRKNG